MSLSKCASLGLGGEIWKCYMLCCQCATVLFTEIKENHRSVVLRLFYIHYQSEMSCKHIVGLACISDPFK